MNDLKRTKLIAASETGLGDTLLHFLSGKEPELHVDAIKGIMKRVTQTYPIPKTSLVFEDDDDTEGGIVIDRFDNGSDRIITRSRKSDGGGGERDYYLYRDLAMTRLSAFRPEWIKQLLVVDNADPSNPDVRYNRGHFMAQITFFFGPVNFYYKSTDGKSHCAEMATGDSNFILPFVPHSFASRDGTQDAFIVAVTFGNRSKRAMAEIEQLEPDVVRQLAGDKRDISKYRSHLLTRLLTESLLTVPDFIQMCVERKLSARRALRLLNGGCPSVVELDHLSSILHRNTEDLLTLAPLRSSEEVVLKRYEAHVEKKRTYGQLTISTAARNKHYGDTMSFIVAVQSEPQTQEKAVASMSHTFLYNCGTDVITLARQHDRETLYDVLRPGDSAYVRPMTSFTLSKADHPSPLMLPGVESHLQGRHCLVVRIPGLMDEQCLDEMAMFPRQQESFQRVSGEWDTWF